MRNPVRVNLHCHSSFSDGVLEPEELARRLARDGVRYASLTDHDTLDGLARFKEATAAEGIGCISGVEILAEGPSGIVHLLAYGFDPDDQRLRQVLEASHRAARPTDTPAVGVGLAPPVHAPAAEEVLTAVHGAGGRAFLAHPLNYGWDASRLETNFRALRALGLDGLEAIYSPYGYDESQRLIGLARDCGLLVSGGSDFHSDDLPLLSQLGIDMPDEVWRAFRDSLRAAPQASPAAAPPIATLSSRPDRTSFFLRILLPTLLAISLFVVSIFALVVPAFEDALVARKREMIRELTNSAQSILAEYHDDEKSGRLSRSEAQKAAISRIQFLRYGKEGKDYFWITDMRPHMVVHPYRTDLNGKDLSQFRDPKGNRVFVEFVRLVQARREGYHEYVWQWKDDPGRLAPKQSYVKGFAPWGWVIGTGIYIEDVRAETAAITGRIIRIFSAIAPLIIVLLLFVTHQSFRIEKRRRAAEDALIQSHEKYRSMVEASLDGMMVLVGGRLTYTNQTLLALLGYSEAEWILLELDEVVLWPEGENGSGLKQSLLRGELPAPTEARLRKKDGGTIDVLLTAEPITLGARTGMIVIAKDLSAHKGLMAALDESHLTWRALAQSLRASVLRVGLDRRMIVLDGNPAAVSMFDLGRDAADGLSLRDLFDDPEELEAFRVELLSGAAASRVAHLRGSAGTLVVSLCGVVARNTRGAARFFYVVAEEVVARQRDMSERDALIAELQTPLLSLSEPVKQFMRALPHCDLRTSVAQAATLMVQSQMSALLVDGPDGAGVGLVTDSDFRQRVVGAGLSPDRPVHEVMSAPLVAIAPSALGYEAIMRMREANAQHLAVRDEMGKVLGVVRNKELLELERYPLALLSGAIRRARRGEELFNIREKLPFLVKAMVDAGAKPRNVCRAIAAISDALAQRFVDLAVEAQGRPPVPFAFIWLGSGGREEQTLVTDQDNAIIYADDKEADAPATHRYFHAMGERVCEWLDRAGLPRCKGGMMASNPRWCASLCGWQEHFAGWIGIAEPQNLLDFNTFFDLRCVSGTASLVADLRRFIAAELARTPSFFGHLARNAVHFKPPITFFGKIVAESDPHGTQRTFNIKDALTPIVSFARLYALCEGLTVTNTGDRLDLLHDGGAINHSTHAETAMAFQLLMSLRLRFQTAAVDTDAAPTNQINIKSLTEIETTTLKQIFAQVAAIQKKISFDYPGVGL